MIVNVCVVLVAAAMVGVALYTMFVLKEARSCLKQAEDAIVEARRQMAAVLQEAMPFLKTGHALSLDIQTKLADFDQWSKSVRDAGRSVRQVARSVGRVSAAVKQTAVEAEDAIHQSRDRIVETAEWVGTGVKLWQAWQSQRRDKPEMKMN